MIDKTRIIFTGDIAFSKYFQDGWQNEGCLDPTVEKFLNQSDYVIANIEAPLSDRKITSERLLNHVSSPNSSNYLENLGINIWNLANNHIMDCGPNGLIDTLKIAKESGCKTIGAGNNIKEALTPIIIGDTVKIGVLSVASSAWEYVKAGDSTPGALTWDKMDIISETMQVLKQRTDWIVLVVHGGDEYCDLALPYIREKYRSLLDLGADIIVGHHPHVVQNYERIGNKMIFYSLGNFIFDTENQRDFAHTDNGILLGINFEKNTLSFDSLPIHIDRGKQTVGVGMSPPVFCEIEPDEYSRLWPLEARKFYSVDLKKRKKLSSRLRNANWILFLGHEFLACRHKREREIQMGRLISLLGEWKQSSLKEVSKYLTESLNEM